MAVIADCPGCQMGLHDKHVAHWGVRPEGIIDGEYCQCPGDCRDRNKEAMDRLFNAIFHPERSFTIRFELEEVSDGVFKLKKMTRGSTVNLSDEDLVQLTESWAQSDEFTDEICSQMLEVISGKRWYR